MTRVLITGATGFIGHHLVAYLLDHTNWYIVTLDRLDVSSSLGRLTDILKGRDKTRVSFIFHDLKAEINEITAGRIGDVDFIFHLAASSHVDRSIQDPVGFAWDNVMGTTHLLNWARKVPNLRRFFNFSTDEVFGPTPPGVAFTEMDRHNPSNPYSAAKSGADQMGHAFFVTYSLPVITTYTVNVFGERQFGEKFVSKAIRCVLNKRVLDIHCSMTDPSGVKEIGTRTWIDVQDVCEALVFLVEMGLPGASYNITGDEELDNLEIAHLIATTLDSQVGTRFVDSQTVRPGYDNRYALSGQKLKDLGWVPHKVAEGLPRVVRWMANHQEWL